MKPDNNPQNGVNQGEGDRVASRHYNEQLRAFVAGGNVGPAARDAERYVERDPLDARRAERKAKRGPRSTRVTLDELIATGRTLVERVRPIVERALGRVRARLDRK